MKNYSRGEIATFLTIVAVVLMAAGALVGGKLVQVGPRANPQAARATAPPLFVAATNDQMPPIKQVAPTSKIRAGAEYDAGAALIRLQDWTTAAQVLTRDVADTNYVHVNGDQTMNGVVKIEMAGHGGQVVGVVIHVVAVAGLAGAAVAAAVMGDDAIAVLEEEQHLRVPVIGGQRPAVVEMDGLGILWAILIFAGFLVIGPRVLMLIR